MSGYNREIYALVGGGGKYGLGAVRRCLRIVGIVLLCLVPTLVLGHQAPYSVAYLDVSPDKVSVELHIPLSELELAFGHNLTRDPQTLIQRMGPALEAYVLAHMHAYEKKDEPWAVKISQMTLDKEEQVASGPPFWELRVHLLLVPRHDEGTRHFMLHYDGVVHQVINHIIFVTIRHDWETGRSDSLTAESNPMTIRISSDNTVHPLEVNLDQGSMWTGFENMVSLGMDHIREGTDHLLFLLALMLPAPLLVKRRRWYSFGGVKYSVNRLIKIITAFTVGHSITLLLGALGLIAPSPRIVEILIAVSIFVSALHALHPLFPRKEYLISGGFGLIHGMAFSSVLSGMHLGGGVLIISIFGFNLGIELMQLLIVGMIIPWLLLLSQGPLYGAFRVSGGIAALIASSAWILERVSGYPNLVTVFIANEYRDAIWLVVVIAVVSIISYFGCHGKVHTQKISGV